MSISGKLLMSLSLTRKLRKSLALLTYTKLAVFHILTSFSTLVYLVHNAQLEHNVLLGT